MALTRHHLIPRMRHRQARIRRQFDRQQRAGSIAWLCRACHSHVHAVLNEQQLAEHYHTLEALRAQAEIARFAAWLRKKPVDFIPASSRRLRE